MGVILDPFQTIIRANFPSGILVPNIGSVTGKGFTDPNIWNAACNSANDFTECIKSLDLSGNWVSFTVDFPSNICDCSQQTYQMTGRTSGATISCDHTGLAALGLDCRSICPDLRNDCYLLVDGNRILCNALDNTASNNWNSTTQKHHLVTTAYTFGTATDFQLGESIDVKLDGFSYDISSITIRDLSSVWVNTVGSHKFRNGADVKIDGTVNYDGTYNILSASTVSFAIGIAHVEDEFTGTASPHYLGL